MWKVHHLTKEGYKSKLLELEKLKNEELPDILKRLKAAREQWDLSENAEYEQAMEDKAIVEKKIADLEEFLENIEIIENASIDTVGYGNKVIIERDWHKESYEIVGSWEVDIFKNKISLDSPLGMAIKGKKVWQKAIIDSPKWEYEIKIISIS